MEQFSVTAMERSDVPADYCLVGFVSQHMNECGVDLQDRPLHVAPADAIGRVGNQGAEIGFRAAQPFLGGTQSGIEGDRKSTRLNSSHGSISYAVFCLKKKKKTQRKKHIKKTYRQKQHMNNSTFE